MRCVDDLTREFLIESNEGLDCMERSLTELESRPEDSALIAEIFRAVHTIKGTTGFLGFHRLESLAHSGENVLGLLREGKIKSSQQVITILLRTMDALRGILKRISVSGDDGAEEAMNDAPLIRELDQLSGLEAGPVYAAKSREKKKAASRKKAAATAKSLEESTASIQLPAMLQQLPQPAPPPEPVQYNRRATDVPGGASQAATESTLRVDVELLNRMMNLVGELVLTRNQILQHNSVNHGFNTLARRLDMVTSDLRESVMKARMQPVSYIFQKFPRMVRDLCHICNKHVQLDMVGQETELDKSLLEAIKDPLIHAVRNAIDHGMEPEADRVAIGKPVEGTVRLRAIQEGGHVVIEVSDDGRGMDPKRILQKAVDKGLVPAENAENMSEREIFQLVFMPGFSTAEKVTNVSGRGVGMDVVRTNVEKIGGKVELDSALGKGTTLRLRIPLTLAIVPALVVRACGETFAIPQNALFELVYVSEENVSTAIERVDNVQVYRLRGDLLPVVRLDELLKLPMEKSEQKKFFMVVLDADGRRFGLVVDELLDPEEIVVKPLSVVLRQMGLFSGATILGNGSLALILDPTAAAIRSNIALRNVEEDAAIAPAIEAEVSPEFLVFSTGRKGERPRRMALPLEIVDRIETVPFNRIEFAGQQPVMQYLGGLLPLLDESNLLHDLSESSSTNAAQTPVQILVIHHESEAVGIVVREVLDVTRGNIYADANLPGAENATSKVARIGDRVTVLQNMATVREILASQNSESVKNNMQLEVA